MSITIGSARIGENGSITGGKDGDQKQKSTPDYVGEVSLQNFYVHSKGWYIIRLKNADYAKKCASSMKTACNNPNIGYNQNERYDVVKQGTSTKTKCNADCSALVRTCFKEATGKDPGDFNTSSEVSVLKETGLVDVLSYTSGTTLYTGDILVTKTKGHTVIVTDGASRTTTKSPTVAIPVIKKGNKGSNVKLLQKNLNSLGFKGKDGKKLTVDGEAGDNTIFALKSFQKKYSLAVDGIYGEKSYKKMNSLIK